MVMMGDGWMDGWMRGVDGMGGTWQWNTYAMMAEEPYT